MNPKRHVNAPDISFSVMPYYRLIIVAVVYALLAPFLGPMLDHHFAEQQYNHQHIYFGTTGTKHVHFYELLHPHSHAHHAPITPTSNGPASNELPNEVVYLTSQDGAGQSVSYLTATSLYIDFVFPGLGDSRSLLRSTGQDGLPPEIFIPPPKRPPRV
jgi:hypothetical protein